MTKLNRIREVRLRHQFQIRSLARHLGVTDKEAREIERPENDVRSSTLIKVAAWLQVPVGELLVEDGLSGNCTACGALSCGW
jgi:transcriptional regulator with XRE-family HTH domain